MNTETLHEIINGGGLVVVAALVGERTRSGDGDQGGTTR